MEQLHLTKKQYKKLFETYEKEFDLRKGSIKSEHLDYIKSEGTEEIYDAGFINGMRHMLYICGYDYRPSYLTSDEIESIAKDNQ